MTKDPLHIIDILSPTDALAVLRSLAGSDQQFAARIAALAPARLRGLNPEEVAAALPLRARIHVRVQGLASGAPGAFVAPTQ